MDSPLHARSFSGSYQVETVILTSLIGSGARSSDMGMTDGGEDKTTDWV